MRYQSKNIFITGASRGIGLAIAKAFAKEGANVLMTARSEENLKAEALAINKNGGKAWFHTMDVTSDESVINTTRLALQEFGQIHVLINNAAVAYQEVFLKSDPSHARTEMETNYFGLLRVSRAILPSMIEKGEGTLVVVSSVTGRVPFPTQSTYSASKAALIAFAEALRGELKPDGIKILVVLPGVTDTDMAKNIVMSGSPTSKARAGSQDRLSVSCFRKKRGCYQNPKPSDHRSKIFIPNSGRQDYDLKQSKVHPKSNLT